MREEAADALNVIIQRAADGAAAETPISSAAAFPPADDADPAVRDGDNAVRAAPPGTHVDAGDGLLRCDVCGLPVQCRVRIWGKDRVVSCRCRCREEAARRERQREEEMERRRRIRHLKANGIQERHLLDWRFDTAEESRGIRIARGYVESWEKARAKNLGLLLWGDVGTGKTFMAACIANALLEEGVPVLMTNFSKVLNQMGGLYTEERHSYIASFSEFQLLIIDDLGIERSSEFVLEQIYAVIDERYKAGLPLIITTNLSVSELRNPTDEAHARIYSRVLEMCTPIHVDGADRRAAIGREKQKEMREVLKL